MQQEANNYKELLKGTIGPIILRLLNEHGKMYGYEISQRVKELSDGRIQIKEGSLYPALRRLEDKGFVSSDWGLSENHRRARFYSLTTAGRRQLREEAQAWSRFSGAMTRVMRAAPALP